MKKRGLFKTIFGEKEKIKDTVNSTEFNMYSLLNSFNSIYQMNTGNAWDMNIVRSAVDAYCRNFAKLKAKHTRIGKTGTSRLEKLLNYKPNSMMEAYSFYYKIAANLKLTNNAFIYPECSDSGDIIAFWPLMSNQIVLLEYKKQLYLKFIFKTGKIKVVPYEEIIHLRGHFFDNDIFGSSNRALRPALETANAIDQGVSNGAKMINSVRGILSAKISSKEDDLTKQRDKFVENNFKISSNGSGIIVTDSKMDYKPIDENEWNAFYEGAIEPIAIQMSQCFTNKIFTDNERNFGNEITFEANRLQYASNVTKVSVVQALSPVAVLMIDDVREMFNLAPLPNGEGQKVLQSLNYINSKIADNYQSGNKNDENDKGDKGGGSNGEE